MKKTFFCILFILLSTALFAEITDFAVHYELASSPNDFDVTYFKYDFMKENTVKKASDVVTTQSFSVENNRYEERFTLFADTGTTEETIKMEYMLFALDYAERVSGKTLHASDFTAFKESDVADEFNGDFGHMCFVVKPTSTYARGYRYLLLEFFCKKNQGIVMRTILTNDKTVFTEPTNNFTFAYHAFKFKEDMQLFW